MWDAINRLIELAVGPVRRLVHEVRDAIAGVVSTLTTVMGGLGGKFLRLAQTVSWWRWIVRRQALEVYNTLRWLLTIRIPGVIANAVDQLRRWTITAIGSAERALRSLVDTVTRWVQGQVNRILSLVDSLTRWAQARVNEVWHTLTRVRDLVFALLTSPQRLAEWLGGAIVAPVLRYLDGHAEAVAEWLLRASVRVLLRAAPRIERFITRMF